ncbi:hypothetical protein NM208_g9727 [Fusarium decemcellulare]|uniref:Uncharacterized protein n=1 Tax=Fusarium decemcellulare TaxID=57161 RepID=A0ACC1S0F9_9HYPO|nr:hypothetical protein NM208_g9727 [Fusarium decemcellulare]
MAPGEDSARRPKTKRRRITQACDYCHQRSIRCRVSSDNQSCQNCRDFAQPCTYNRKPRRRGTKPRTTTSATTIATPELALEDPARLPSAAFGIAQGDVTHEHPAQPHWEAPKMASQAIVMDLVEIYFEVVYPIFPFFHQPSFIRRISRAEYTTNRTLFAVTMALCALAKAQLLDLGHESDINCLRAHAILAITAIQNGKIRDLHWHLGIYHTLVAMDGLHDESNWPQSIDIVEREERRRLFWSIYTLDIYASVVWGGIIRCRENQSNVAYPIEVEDEVIGDAALTSHSPATKETSPRNDSAIQSDCWLSGWNFITDLYHVLEHALTRPRPYRYRATRSAFLQNMFVDDPTATDSSVRERVLRMYLDLPTCFKETPPMVHCVRKDRFGFQAANITATVQLLRIVLMAASGASMQERCQIATEVVEAFVSIPVSYLLAISTPLLHHLGGIGTILGSVRGESLSEGGYAQVRAVMLSMAQLLESLEAIHRSASASQNLRSQVLQIDEYMARQRQGLPPQAEVTTREGITEESSLQVQRNADYEQIVSDISTSWMLPVSGDFLGDLAWDFDFG